MSISPFFLELRSSYQSEMDDLTFDSEGRDVLRQRLTQKRGELGFLLQMMELSPEMVAVIFHQGFQFKKPSVLEHLLAQEPEEFPEWESLADAVQLAPWSQELAQQILKEPMGAWFMTVAAGLEYMYSRPNAASTVVHEEEDDQDEDADEGVADDDVGRSVLDSDADAASGAREREEAGADWMAEQGFDRKE